MPGYKGDGFCDDENNNRKCGWDGGDCCYKSLPSGKVVKEYCKMVGCDGGDLKKDQVIVYELTVRCCRKCDLIELGVWAVAYCEAHDTSLTCRLHFFLVQMRRSEQPWYGACSVRIARVQGRRILRRREQQYRVRVRWRRLLSTFFNRWKSAQTALQIGRSNINVARSVMKDQLRIDCQWHASQDCYATELRVWVVNHCANRW